jgi:hypothetical protein
MKRLSLIGLLLLPLTAGAHSLSYIQGDAVVHPDKLELALKVRPEDVLLSAGMTMIVLDTIDKAEIAKGLEAHQNYLLKGIVIQDGEGHRLTGKVTNVESLAIPPAGIPLETLMATNFVYHIEYPLAKPPESLGFRQLFNTGNIVIPVVMQLTVTRAGQTSGTTIPVPDGEQPETVALDWKNATPPPTTAIVKPVTLESSDSFLYIQNDEVRLEILMPVPVLETWMPVPRADAKLLEISEQTALLPALEKFFVAHSEVKVDGVLVKPKLDRVDFFGIDFRDFAMRPPQKQLTASTARLGVILSYSTKGTPREVEVKWTLFNDKAITARAVVFAYDKGTRVALAPAKPTFGWKNPGVPPLPKIEALLTKQDAGTDEARAMVAETLLRNVYRGFDYRAESDVYDALAQSVQGELLTDLYLKIKQGLTVQEQGGAVATVQEVKVTKAEPLPGKLKDGFNERITWQVTGTVEHWGHIHTRVNEYTADLGIAASDGAWKIVSMNVTKQSQVKSSMSVRKL